METNIVQQFGREVLRYLRADNKYRFSIPLKRLKGNDDIRIPLGRFATFINGSRNKVKYGVGMVIEDVGISMSYGPEKTNSRIYL